MAEGIERLDPALRAESEAFVAQLGRVLELEAIKREMPSDDPGFPALARQVEGAVQGLLERASEQRRLAVETHQEVTAQGATGESIVDVPADLSLMELLAKWRETERELLEVDPGSERAGRLREDSLSYQRAYQSLFEERNRRG